MDLTYTPEEAAFRAEARSWLEANVPSPALPSGDTAEGFALHRDWEKRLFDARYAVVSWPERYGGREATLMEWLIFEEEYYRAGGPQRITQNGIFLLAPTSTERRVDEIARVARGYVYYVSLTGITGAGHLDVARPARSQWRLHASHAVARIEDASGRQRTVAILGNRRRAAVGRRR